MNYIQHLIITIFLCVISFSGFAHKEAWDEDRSEWSPLMNAIYKGNSGRVERLIKNGEPVNYVANTRWQMTAFGVAVNTDNIEIVKLLLSTDSIDCPSDYLWSACVFNKSTAIIQLLFNQEENANDTTEIGYSILMRAVQGGEPKIVNYLLEHKANPNLSTNNNGMTALMFATMDGNIEVIKLLLLYGADKNMKSKNGKRAYDFISTYAGYSYKNPRETIINELQKLLE